MANNYISYQIRNTAYQYLDPTTLVCLQNKMHICWAGFLLNKKPGMHQPQRVENAKILIANTPMDTDKIKVFGSRVKVDNIAKASTWKTS